MSDLGATANLLARCARSRNSTCRRAENLLVTSTADIIYIHIEHYRQTRTAGGMRIEDERYGEEKGGKGCARDCRRIPFRGERSQIGCYLSPVFFLLFTGERLCRPTFRGGERRKRLRSGPLPPRRRASAPGLGVCRL